MTQDFTQTPSHSTPPTGAPSSPPVPRVASSVSALAIVSLVLAISGFFCIGPLTFLPAVICGHIALSKIKRCKGALGGWGMALSGTIIGYIGLLLSVFFFAFVLWKTAAIDKGSPDATVVQLVQPQDLSDLRQIATACIIYIDDHDGQTPPDLATALGASEMATALLQDDEGHLRYELVMSGSVNSITMPSDTPMIRDLQSGAIAYADGHIDSTPRPAP